MSPNKDYYAIMGVLPSIEAAALDAVYKALVKKYHPDVYKGDKKNAEEKTKLINEAYSVLRDLKKREEYDKLRQNQNKGFGSFEQDNNYEEQNDPIVDQISKDWKIVVDLVPKAEEWRINLSKISRSLAYNYQNLVLMKKEKQKYEEIAKSVKFEYLKLYFGDNIEIQKFAEELIILRRKDAAIYLNDAVRILGNPKNMDETKELIEKIKTKFKLNLKNTSDSSAFWIAGLLMAISFIMIFYTVTKITK